MINIKKLTIISAIILISCGPSKVTDSIEGKYLYKYPSGQVEILCIKNDNSFSQTIYARENDYLNKVKPLYINKGNWNNGITEIEFTNWLAISYLGSIPDSILSQPMQFSLFKTTWYAPTIFREGQINVYVENGYVLKKVEE